MKELREVPAYLELIDEAKGEGADLIATLLRHVGWNKPDGLLSIYETTSAVGREAFSAVGFPETGPTGASIREVLSRAVRVATDHGHAQLSRSISDFVAATWSGLDSSEAEAHDFSPASDDVLAESGDVDDAEVRELASQADQGHYAVADQQVTAKTRGSAQRVFAERVKRNYGLKCALTGIATRDFLVASHIVPWSEDESIRLDPANGICLSTFVDRAFDTGYLLIHDDYTVHVVWDRVGSDVFLRDALAPFDGQSLTLPSTSPPTPEFLRRRLGGS